MVSPVGQTPTSVIVSSRRTNATFAALARRSTLAGVVFFANGRTLAVQTFDTAFGALRDAHAPHRHKTRVITIDVAARTGFPSTSENGWAVEGPRRAFRNSSLLSMLLPTFVLQITMLSVESSTLSIMWRRRRGRLHAISKYR